MTLFDDPLKTYDPDPPAQLTSDTSREAAEAILPKAATLRRAVFDWLERRGDVGGTDEEIQDALGMAQNTERPRRVELWRGGFIRDSGRTRLTRSKRKAVVWIVTVRG